MEKNGEQDGNNSVRSNNTGEIADECFKALH